MERELSQKTFRRRRSVIQERFGVGSLLLHGGEESAQVLLVNASMGRVFKHGEL